jgi:hypothetical protein
VPQPADAQIGIDWAAIIAAIKSIGSAISNVIGGGLGKINIALALLNKTMSAIQTLFQTKVYPQNSISRAQGLVGLIQGLYLQIRALSHLNVASATLPLSQSLENVLLSRNPLGIPTITANFQNLYGTVPVAQNASPHTRQLIDMTDAVAQDAMKRSVAIDAEADTEMQAADRINTELETAAPGTAPMIEAEASAWLVRANALTQSALGDLIREHAIALENGSAQLKTNAFHAAQLQQHAVDSLK